MKVKDAMAAMKPGDLVSIDGSNRSRDIRNYWVEQGPKMAEALLRVRERSTPLGHLPWEYVEPLTTGQMAALLDEISDVATAALSEANKVEVR